MLNREDWACSNCWQGLIFDTIPIWWAERCSQNSAAQTGVSKVQTATTPVLAIISFLSLEYFEFEEKC